MKKINEDIIADLLNGNITPDCSDCPDFGTPRCPETDSDGKPPFVVIDRNGLIRLISILEQIIETLDNISHDDSDIPALSEDDLIEKLVEYADELECSEDDELEVWILKKDLEQFLHPLFDEVIESYKLQAAFDKDRVYFNLSEVCAIYDIDVQRVFDSINI